VFEEKGIELKLEYFIDFTLPHLRYDDTHGIRFECQLVKRHSLDWLYENAEGFSFSYLYDIGKITDDLIHFVRYAVEQRLDPIRIFLVGLTVYFIIESIKQIIDEISDRLAEVAGFFPVIKALIKAFPTLLKATLTIIAIIALLKDLAEYILSGDRRHNGMYSLDMATVAANHLGLTFKSSILEGPYNKMFHLPSKDDKGFLISDPENYGYPGRNSPIYDFGSYLRVIMTMFNAAIRINDGVLRLERRDFWRSMTSYTLPKVRLGPFSYNTSALYSNYVLRYVTDPSDLNTLENTDDLNYQSTTEPKIKIEQDLNLLKGLYHGTIPLAHGYRKNELNEWQKFFNVITRPIVSVANAMLKAVYEVRKAFDKITKLIKKLAKVLKFVGIKINASAGNDPGDPQQLKLQTIENKLKGVIKLSADTFAVDKVFLMEGGKVTEDSYEKMSAEYLYKNYHIINEFDPKYNNQGKIYQDVSTVFCLKDFVTLLDYNGFKTHDGKSGDMLKIRWKFKSNNAVLDFILYETYTNNFRNVTPPDVIVIDEEDENKARYHGDGFSDEFD